MISELSESSITRLANSEAKAPYRMRGCSLDRVLRSGRPRTYREYIIRSFAQQTLGSSLFSLGCRVRAWPLSNVRTVASESQQFGSWKLPPQLSPHIFGKILDPPVSDEESRQKYLASARKRSLRRTFIKSLSSEPDGVRNRAIGRGLLFVSVSLTG